MKILVTGGCGFIGTNFIDFIIKKPEVEKVINVDCQTYAGQGQNLEHFGIENNQKYQFYKSNIADKKEMQKIFENEKPEIVFNFAAESHVDRSIENAEDFVITNVTGTANLLDCSKKFGIKKFIQISTDEVYGSTNKESFKEGDFLNPSSPYSASKAGAELIALSYFKTHKLPVIITRSANNYGPYQFPEKLLPKFITNLIDKKKVPLMWSEENPGLNVRDWLHVLDNCEAIWFVSQNGKLGEAYNIPGENEKTNIEMTKMLLNIFGFSEDMIEKVPHRLGHDFRYSINGEKLKQLGFEHKHIDLQKEIENLVKWYKENENWWRKLL